MLVRMKNTKSFYAELRSLLPEIEALEVWNSYDSEGVGFIGAEILTTIGKVTINLGSNNKTASIKKLLDFFELSYNEFEDGANSYVYTDFLPTILVSKNKELREQIKSRMGAITRKQYNQLIEFGFYAEKK